VFAFGVLVGLPAGAVALKLRGDSRSATKAPSMKALQVLRSASFGPGELTVICSAFDQAWSAVAHHFHTALSIEAARLVLANAILGHAAHNRFDAHELMNVGLSALAGKYRIPVAERSADLYKAVAATRAAIERSKSDIERMIASVRSADGAIRRSAEMLANQAN